MVETGKEICTTVQEEAMIDKDRRNAQGSLITAGKPIA